MNELILICALALPDNKIAKYKALAEDILGIYPKHEIYISFGNKPTGGKWIMFFKDKDNRSYFVRKAS